MRSIASFQTSVESLHDAAISRAFATTTPTIEGVDLGGIDIDFGTAITASFRLYMFALDSTAITAAPSRFEVKTTGPDAEQFTAFFGCGLKDAEGEFWYPRMDRHLGRYDSAPDHEDDWGIYFKKVYGEGGK